MSSPARSVSRGRSRTPDHATRSRTPSNDRMNGGRSRSRSRSRSPTRDRSRSRSRSYRQRSYSRSPSRPESPDAPRSAKVVVEKLTKNVNEGHLREIFGAYGEIEAVEMPMNRQFMMNKGIAYVLYTQPAHAEDAIAHMHEAQLDGALITVSIVLPRRRFSRSPPAKRPPPNRFGEPNRFREQPRGGGARPGGDRSYRPSPPHRGGGRRPSPRRGGGGRGGYRDRYDDRSSYRPRSHSASPPPRRRRSYSRSRSRSPGPPREGRRRSPSYDSYGSRTPSRERAAAR